LPVDPFPPLKAFRPNNNRTATRSMLTAVATNPVLVENPL